MKKSIYLLSLITPFILTAAEEAPAQVTEESPSCPPEETTFCEPICYGYLRPYYDLECDWGLALSVDFLYWYAKESCLPYVTKMKSISNGAGSTVLSPTTYKYIDGEWDPGVRVGLGWNTCHDGWDLYLNWTYMHNSSSESTSVADFGQANTFYLPSVGQSALANPWINASFYFDDSLDTSARLFDKVSAKWSLNFNQIDLELGRKSWVSPCFTLRPYTALRGAWVQTKFKTDSFRNTTHPTDQSTVSILFKDHFKSKYWGVGFLVGLQPNWHFCESIILFSNFDGALIWGDFDGDKKEKYLDERASGTRFSTSGKSTSSTSSMQAILDLSLGLRWERTWCCNRYRTALDLGWENHYWFDFDTHYQTFGHFSNTDGSVQGFTSFNEVQSDLMMGGLMVRFKIDF